MTKAQTIDDFGVMEAKARLWAARSVMGYFPLYVFEKVAELIGGTSGYDTHVLDGTTYYMPKNGVEGVDWFHGDHDDGH
jgi:hypothetical protein